MLPVPFCGRDIKIKTKAKYVWRSFQLFNFGGNVTIDSYCDQLNRLKVSLASDFVKWDKHDILHHVNGIVDVLRFALGTRM